MSLMDVQNVSKAFREYSSEWKRVVRWFGVPTKPSEENWVLRNVSFSIGEGEAIGIAGQNGAGKSTLLKIITGTLLPTEGSVTVNGRIAAMLELGMGFNPELTGRQNVYHAAGLMGFSEADIDSVIDEIEAFAEIGNYFDEPVRTYSSGMQMRVAFSVATAYRPEVLIVDEALSVGDAYFQHKSFDRIRTFREQGTTLLIVSHDRTAIQSLCDRAILLENGAVIKDGNPEEVFDFYNAIIAEKDNSTVKVRKLENGKAQTKSGTGEATVISASLLNEAGDSVYTINVGEPVRLAVDIAVKKDVEQLVLGYLIKDRLGQPVFGTNTYHMNQPLNFVQAGSEYSYTFQFRACLGIGSYSIAVALHGGGSHVGHNYEWRDIVIMFNVVNMNREQFVGVSWLPPTVSCTK
ncbi:lipopolysaccharide transport system ATP-binding protein [Methylohalomonas lacus]|uniref:Lipopolysaccharide transport system ATP-binding protein n=1 Tax=Methylohalomonas lacus TaxID=398773 RepID=A0AAE3HJS5_9GAMM|nr:ABC transporter ATP-binding protein [Methylohalomonas lacus]MCS3903570.1 lipopolysaccharide transport system ATP-binding protein [Methylohalomonas lacus]